MSSPPLPGERVRAPGEMAPLSIDVDLVRAPKNAPLSGESAASITSPGWRARSATAPQPSVLNLIEIVDSDERESRAGGEEEGDGDRNSLLLATHPQPPLAGTAPPSSAAAPATAAPMGAFLRGALSYLGLSEHPSERRKRLLIEAFNRRDFAPPSPITRPWGNASRAPSASALRRGAFGGGTSDGGFGGAKGAAGPRGASTGAQPLAAAATGTTPAKAVVATGSSVTNAGGELEGLRGFGRFGDESEGGASAPLLGGGSHGAEEASGGPGVQLPLGGPPSSSEQQQQTPLRAAIAGAFSSSSSSSSYVPPSMHASLNSSGSGSGLRYKGSLTLSASKHAAPTLGGGVKASTPIPIAPSPSARMRRTQSFNGGLTNLQMHAIDRWGAAEVAASAYERSQRILSETAEGLKDVAGLVAFLTVLLLGYYGYRATACVPTLLNWQCDIKPWTAGYDDCVSLATIGGVLYGSGPTLQSGPTSRSGASAVFQSLLIFTASLFTFGAIGQLPFMNNALNSSASWEPPALYFYLAAFLSISGGIAWSFYIARSSYEVAISVCILVGVVAMFASPLIVALASDVPLDEIVYHPHHYQLAWTLCLLLRQGGDRPTLLMRWVLLGVCTQGLAAYSAASIVSNS